MKKNIAIALSCIMAMSLMAGCGQSKPAEEKVEAGSVEVTLEEQIAQTGISFVLPEEVDNMKYFVNTKEDGTKVAQTNFDYWDATYEYYAEATSETDPYYFTGKADAIPEMEWTGSGEIDGIAVISGGNEEGSWSAWITPDDSVAYTAYTPENEADTSWLLEQLLFGREGHEESYEDDGELTEAEQPTAVDCITGFTWQAEDGTILHVGANKTYAFYDKDGKNDGKIYFWEAAEDEKSVILLGADGQEVNRLVLDDTETSVIDKDGVIYKESRWVADGTYHCMMNDTYLSEDTLVLTAKSLFWISNTEVAALEVGSTVNNTSVDFMAIEVEALEKVDDKHYVINDSMDLTYDATADAWLLADEQFNYVQLGDCKLTDATKVEDPQNADITSLEAALAAYDMVYADVTVENDIATSIVITGEQ